MVKGKPIKWETAKKNLLAEGNLLSILLFGISGARVDQAGL